MEHDVPFPATAPLAEIPRPAFRYGADGTIQEANVLAERLGEQPLVGMTSEQVIEHFNVRGRYGTGLPPKDSPEQRALGGTEVLNLPLIVATATGPDVYILATAVPIRDDGKITGALCVWRDVSEIEFEMKDRGKFGIKFQDLANLIEVIPLPIRVALNPEASVITGNTLAHSIYGTQPGDNFSASQSQLQFLDRDGNPAKPEELPLQRAAAELKPVENVEMNVVLLDGKRICQVGSTVPFSDPDGRVIGSLGGFVDITDRKRLEKERQLALDATRMGLWHYDLDSNVITVDRRFKEIFKIEVEGDELPKAGTLDTLLRRPQSRLPDTSSGEETVSDPKSPQDPLDYRVTFGDGSQSWIELHWVSYAEDACRGEATSTLVGTVRDITHKIEKNARIKRKSTELDRAREKLEKTNIELAETNKKLAKSNNELAKANNEHAKTINELERSNEELQRFAYVASHDLQEPLRSIISFSQLLERKYRGRLDADADDYIQFIVEGGNRMQALILDLLKFSRVETAAKPLEPTDVAAVVAGVVRTMEASLGEAGATVTVGDLPVVMADAAQLEQVFTNLLGNAIKYRRPDVPSAIRVMGRSAGSMVEFSIEDNGIGIETEYFDRIFVIFQRLHTKEAYPGTGIGLAVVKKIVERHGGTVRVESVPGEGSTFFFTLPPVVTGGSEPLDSSTRSGAGL